MSPNNNNHVNGSKTNEQREDASLGTRKGDKKAEPVSISPEQAKALKDQPDTPQGRRDALLMCLLLDHGLRVGEVAGLTVADFDLKAGELRFYCSKVDLMQNHRLTTDALEAARAYLPQDAPVAGPIWRCLIKGGRLTDQG